MTLEREDRARARGAKIYATVDGYGSTCDAYHRVQMDPDGAEIVRAMTLALRRAGRRPRRSATSTITARRRSLNDAVEARCVRRVFGASRRASSPGSSTKSMIGHPQGASGAAGVVAAALALSHRRAAADDQPAPIRIRRAISTSSPTRRARGRSTPRCATASGFGSKNSALVLGPRLTTADAGRAHRGRGTGRIDRRARCSRAPARACSSSIARRFRATSCAATRSIPARSRSCSRSVCGGGPLATAPPLAGMLLTGPTERVDGRYGDGVAGRAITRRDARRVAARPGDRRRRAIRERARSCAAPLVDRRRMRRPSCAASCWRDAGSLADDARAGGHDDRGRWPPLGPGARARLEPASAAAAPLGVRRLRDGHRRARPTSARCTSGRPPISASRRSAADSRTCAS